MLIGQWAAADSSWPKSPGWLWARPHWSRWASRQSERMNELINLGQVIVAPQLWPKQETADRARRGETVKSLPKWTCKRIEGLLYLASFNQSQPKISSMPSCSCAVCSWTSVLIVRSFANLHCIYLAFSIVRKSETPKVTICFICATTSKATCQIWWKPSSISGAWYRFHGKLSITLNRWTDTVFFMSRSMFILIKSTYINICTKLIHPIYF